MAKLVAIGDSLTQGFASGAISQTEKSYPKIIADCMGLSRDEFRQPNFRGAGGLPINIELLARDLEQKYGTTIDTFEWVSAVFDINAFLDKVEDYWERGAGAKPLGLDVLFHNLAIFGYQAGDPIITARECKDRFKKSVDNVLLPITSASRERAAYRTLNPNYDPLLDAARCQLSAAKEIVARDGRIENLILALGANNALGALVHLEIKETGKNSPGTFSKYNLWSANAFRQDFTALAREVDAIMSTQSNIGSGHVFVANVPHVTIVPLANGVMKNGATQLPKGEKYFDYYKYFFIRDADFNPSLHKHLTGAQAKAIDDRIDEFNIVIQEEVAKRPNWHLVDLCSMLDRLATRRNQGKPSYPLPGPIADLGTRFYEVDPKTKKIKRETGIFSLDGVHPSYCGYAIVAQEFVNVMRPHMQGGMKDVDFAQIRAHDTLVSNPPRTLDDIVSMLGVLEKYFYFVEWLI